MLDKIAFGGASFSGSGAGYGFGKLKDCSEKELFDYLYSNGVRLFDFAPIYGFNNAEKVMGTLIKDVRDNLKLISKAGVTWHDNLRVDMNNSPQVIKKMFDQSLKNFNTDYIDIYFIHWPSKEIDIRYSVEVLENLRSQNKIKYIGLSNTSKDEYIKAKEVAPISYIQNQLNLFEQDLLFETNAKSMGWGTFDKGILSGSVSKERVFEKEDARSHAFWWKKSNWKEKVDFVDQIKIKFDLTNEDLISLCFEFSSKNCNHPIIGFKSINQVEQILKRKEINKNIYNDIINEFKSF